MVYFTCKETNTSVSLLVLWSWLTMESVKISKLPLLSHFVRQWHPRGVLAIALTIRKTLYGTVTTMLML